MTFRTPEKFRVRTGYFASKSGEPAGAFFIPSPTVKERTPLKIIASAASPEDDLMWDHVSVSLPHRCPTWEEMCYVKSLFWDDEDTVMQLHPPKSQWISNHKYCLHLWKPTAVAIPMPPSITVGYQELGDLGVRP